jgi:hypothetical protein
VKEFPSELSQTKQRFQLRRMQKPEELLKPNQFRHPHRENIYCFPAVAKTWMQDKEK